MRVEVASLLIALFLAGLATPLSAHHSFAAEYDRNRPIKFTGIVTKME